MEPTEELTLECKRQAESCLYTSVALFIWLRTLRTARILFIIVPLIEGSLASGRLLSSGGHSGFLAFCAFFAGVLPTVYAALKLDRHLRVCSDLASEFKNLQDRFRQAALLGPSKSFAEFEKQFE